MQHYSRTSFGDEVGSRAPLGRGSSLADYSLKNDIVISGLVYPAEACFKFDIPFLQNVKEKGAAL